MDPTKYLPRWIVLPIGLALVLSTIASQVVSVFVGSDAAPEKKPPVAAATLAATTLLALGFGLFELLSKRPSTVSARRVRTTVIVALVVLIIVANAFVSLEFYSRVFAGVSMLELGSASWRAFLPAMIIVPLNILPFCVSALIGLDPTTNSFTTITRYVFLAMFLAVNAMTAFISGSIFEAWMMLLAGWSPLLFGLISVTASVLMIGAGLHYSRWARVNVGDLAQT